MSRILAAAFGAVVLVCGISPAAQATQPAPHCKALSSNTRTQVRHTGDGWFYRYVTTTTARCRGKVVTSYSATAWTVSPNPDLP